jgi:CheY-like chemotaxis protein
VLDDSTADFAFTLLMAAARRVVEGDNFTRAGRYRGWAIDMMLGTDIFGATLGIIGIGRIGRGMAHRAKGFNMRVLYYDPHPLPPDAEPADPRAFLADVWATLATQDAVPAFVGEAVRRVLAEEPPASERALVLSHNDVHPSNLVHDGEHLLLLDWELPGMAAGELIGKVRGLSPDCVVIAMSGRPEAARDAAGRGVDAFISKNEPPDKLVSTVLRRVRGNSDVKMPRSVRGGGLSSR